MRVEGVCVAKGDSGKVGIEGVRPLLEALRAGRRHLEEVWLPAHPRGEAQLELERLAGELRVPVHRVERSADVRARASALPELSFEELLVQTGTPRFIVGLDRVTDVGNFGSIARSAETAGVQGIVVELRRSPGLTAAALRVGSGAFEHLLLARTPKLTRAVDLALKEGVQVLAADMGGESFDQLEPEALAGDLFWILGSEELGIRRSLLDRATRRVSIPMRGKLESLGVAAAAAVLLHHTAWLRRALGRASLPRNG